MSPNTTQPTTTNIHLYFNEYNTYVRQTLEAEDLFQYTNSHLIIIR